MPRLPPSEKRKALMEQRAALDEQLRNIDKAEREQARKDETRRKIVAGAIALEHLEKNPNDPAAQKIKALLNEFVETRDRALFPFLPSNGPERPAAKTAKADTLPPDQLTA